MNGALKQARRYHWLSEGLETDLLQEPKVCRLPAGGNWIRNSSSALPLVVSRVSEMRDPGRAAGRIGVCFDLLQGKELGFDFRLTGLGSKASSLVCRLENLGIPLKAHICA